MNKLTLKAKGLFLNSNSLSAIPEGGLLEADDIVIDKDEIIESRRGFVLFGDSMTSDVSVVAQQLMNYEDRIIRHFLTDVDKGTIERETSALDGTFEQYNSLVWEFAVSVTSVGTTCTFETATDHPIQTGDTVIIDGDDGIDASIYNGTFTVTGVPTSTTFTYELSSTPAAASPASTQVLQERTLNDIIAPENAIKIRSVESNGNLYFTSNQGVRKIDTVESTVVEAGGVKALDTDLEIIRETGFLTIDSQVAYRVVWGFKDANQNLILGAPSQRVVVSNETLPSLVLDFNNLVQGIQDAADAATGGDILDNSPTGPFALYTDLQVASNATAADVDDALRDLCDKLDTDGLSGFLAIKGSYTPPTDSPTSTGELEALVEFYDEIVNELLIHPDITASQQTAGNFTLHTTGAKVKVTFTVPAGITTSHFYQIYRTAVATSLNDNLVAGESDIAGDTMQLVFEDNPTLSEIELDKVEITDITPDSFRGDPLYTNANQEGIVNSNEVMPFANDIAVYQNMLFLANTKTRHRFNFSFLATVSLNSNVSGDASTLTFTAGSDSFTIGFRDEADGGEDDSAGIALLDQSGTPAQNVDTTARSLVRVINRYDSNDILYAYYLSGVGDVPGKVLIETRGLEIPQFTVQANDSATGSQFSPNLTNAQTSDNEEKPNRLYYSKFQEPEAVPLLQYFEVGKESEPIERILALRDNLFVLKPDGVFKVTGDDPSSLSLTPFDNSTRVLAPESAVVLDNKLYFLSDQGIASASETGISVISRSIENVLFPLLDPSFTNFRKATFGIAYETDRKYIMYTVEERDDEWATQAYVYNTYTRAWTRWTNSKTCGIVNERDNKLYLGPSDANQLEIERKDLTFTDYADREHPITILEVSSEKTGAITSIGTGSNPVIELDAPDHGLVSGDTIIVADSNSTPSIDDIPLEVIKLDNQTLIVPVTVSVAGNTGIWRSGSTTTLKVDTVENLEVGDVILQERTDPIYGYTYNVEAPVAEIDEQNLLVTINDPKFYDAGPATIYKSIGNRVRYAPQHAGDPFIMKHFREAHMRFDAFVGSGIELSFNSDIQKSFETVDFFPDAIARWGTFQWGNQPWGGEAFPAVFRTYVPLGKQRSSFLGVVFEHNIAREQWELEGIDLVFEVMSERISN
jgi:hypothetical protein